MIREQDVGGAPAAASWICVETVTDASAFARMRREWDALLDESRAGIFNAWEWLYPWYRRIGTDRVLAVLSARDRGGKLVGVMPLAFDVRRVAGRRVRRLAFLGENHVGSDYLDLVAVRGEEETVARAFAQALKQASAWWDVLDLTDFDEQSPTLPVFQEAFGDKFTVRVTERYVCPFEPLAAEPFDVFLRRTGRRDNYLRRRKWLEKQPGYRIEKVEKPGQLAGPMADFFRLHAMRWAEDGGSQGIKGPSVEAFHRDATHLLAERGQLRLYTMKVGEQAVASVYAILHRGKFIYFQSGYDPSWRSKSVGLVLVGETFKDSLDAKLTEYDFLRGTETYKSDWTTKTRRTVALRINEPGGLGEWVTRVEGRSKQLRDIAKKALPANAVDVIRRVRRNATTI